MDLSPGKYHERVPRDPVGNLRARRHVLRRAVGNPDVQQALTQLCKTDIIAFTNLFVWQYNPKRPGREVEPFITWDFQDAAIHEVLQTWAVQQEDVLVEKSRELGATWIALIIEEWMCRFHNWKEYLNVSHTEAAVKEAWSKNSLFWKLRFIHEHLPDWLGAATKRRGGFNYETTNSSITGAASTVRTGVGGRASGVLLDEFALQHNDWEIWGHTRDTGPRFIISTHYGLETKFFDLCNKSSIKKIVIHWSQHPAKKKGLYRADPDRPGIPIIIDRTYNFPPDYPFVLDGSPTGGPFPGLRSPWYDKECEARHSARDVAMHLDIDPRGSTSQFFDPLVIKSLQDTYGQEPYWTGDIEFDPDGTPKRLAPSPGGLLRLWMTPDARGWVPPGQYAGGVDVSAGTGATPSCFSLGDARRGEKLLEYANPHVRPAEFAVVVVALCRLFKNEYGDGAFLIWEASGGVGETFGKVVTEELGYYRVYYRIDEFSLNPKKSDRPGWYTSHQTKRALLEELREAYTKNLLVNRSVVALQECLDFEYTQRGVEHGMQRNTNDPSGARENHGDRVIADGLMWKAMQEVGGQGSLTKKPVEDAPYGSLAWRRKVRRHRATEAEFGKW